MLDINLGNSAKETCSFTGFLGFAGFLWFLGLLWFSRAFSGLLMFLVLAEIAFYWVLFQDLGEL